MRFPEFYLIADVVQAANDVNKPDDETTNFFLIVVIAVIVILLLFAIILAVVFVSIGRYWMQAFMSGHPISFIDLLGMKFRKIKPGIVIPIGLSTAHAGFPVKWTELQRAYLQGVDLEKVTTAYVTAQKRELNFTFEELVDAERESRLEKLLKS